MYCECVRLWILEGLNFGSEFWIGIENPRDVWSKLSDRLPEVVGKTDNFQFPEVIAFCYDFWKLERTLTTNSPSKTLEPFIGKSLTLTTSVTNTLVTKLPPKTLEPFINKVLTLVTKFTI